LIKQFSGRRHSLLSIHSPLMLINTLARPEQADHRLSRHTNSRARFVLLVHGSFVAAAALKSSRPTKITAQVLLSSNFTGAEIKAAARWRCWTTDNLAVM
jgi:hypothetical protein